LRYYLHFYAISICHLIPPLDVDGTLNSFHKPERSIFLRES
jgi:hypothetical protein